MKKILFTANTSFSMVNFRYGLLLYLIKKGYKVYVVAPFDDTTKKLNEAGCICIDLKLERKSINPLKELKLIYDLYKIYKSIRADIIFNYTIKPIIYGSIAAKLAGLKSVAINVGLGYTFINKNFITKISHIMYKIALKYPLQVWFINDDDMREFVDKKFVERDKTLVLPSEGVNLQYFIPANNDNKNIFFLLIARVLWDKGIGEYYEAARELKNRYHDVKFGILGKIDIDNPRGIGLDIIQNWHKEGIVDYLGYAEDVRSFIKDATCVVLPSYREGKGMALIEAGAMGKPLIATDTVGCKDIVKDGFNGFLCKVKDAKSLADAMEKILLLDNDELMRIGENSRRYMIENFDEKKVIKIYDNFLNDFFKG